MFAPIEMGPDCEIDASRGGGSFEVSDINDDNKKYTIAWPSGFSFDFGGNIIWRSLSLVSADYDAQARRVTPTVTLKGSAAMGCSRCAARSASRAPSPSTRCARSNTGA